MRLLHYRQAEDDSNCRIRPFCWPILFAGFTNEEIYLVIVVVHKYIFSGFPSRKNFKDAEWKQLSA